MNIDKFVIPTGNVNYPERIFQKVLEAVVHLMSCIVDFLPSILTPLCAFEGWDHNLSGSVPCTGLNWTELGWVNTERVLSRFC